MPKLTHLTEEQLMKLPIDVPFILYKATEDAISVAKSLLAGRLRKPGSMISGLQDLMWLFGESDDTDCLSFSDVCSVGSRAKSAARKEIEAFLREVANGET